MGLKDKTALLIGAGSIASGYVPAFARRQMNLALVSRGESADALAEQAGRNGSAAVALHYDAANASAVEQMFAETVRLFGRIDIVVNGSGGNRREATLSPQNTFSDIAREAIQQIEDHNYHAKMYSIQEYGRYLRNAGHRGSVVNITSMAGLIPLSNIPYYAAAFAALENYVRSAADVYGRQGIGRINNVAVGFVIGDQNRGLLVSPDGTYTTRGQEIITATSYGRFLVPKEVAPSVLFLSDSTQSGAINGATLRIDGGFNLVNLPGSAAYR